MPGKCLDRVGLSLFQIINYVSEIYQHYQNYDKQEFLQLCHHPLPPTNYFHLCRYQNFRLYSCLPIPATLCPSTTECSPPLLEAIFPSGLPMQSMPFTCVTEAYSHPIILYLCYRSIFSPYHPLLVLHKHILTLSSFTCVTEVYSHPLILYLCYRSIFSPPHQVVRPAVR